MAVVGTRSLTAKGNDEEEEESVTLFVQTLRRFSYENMNYKTGVSSSLYITLLGFGGDHHQFTYICTVFYPLYRCFSTNINKIFFEVLFNICQFLAVCFW